MYNSSSNRELLERLVSIASNINDDLDDNYGDTAYNLAEIRTIIEVLEARMITESVDE